MFTSGLAGHQITVVRPTVGLDGAGNGILNWSGAARTTVDGLVQPAPASRARGEQLDEAFLVICSEVDVRALDRIEWGGDLYELVTSVQHWPDPAAVAEPGHCEFVMARGAVPPLSDIVTVRRRAQTRDAEHNPTVTTTVVAMVPGLLTAPAALDDGVVAAQPGVELGAQVVLAVGVDVRPGDVLVVAGRGTWDVVHVVEDRFIVHAQVTRSAP